jgi:NAD(P)-dependent dehydrogenase (short-subunit alcohol dehydrogenase family)
MPLIDRFKGSVALITGSAQGIGKAVAMRLAQEGALTALLDISMKVYEVAIDISKTGARTLAFNVDIGREHEVKKAVGQILKQMGKIDILVNNAGIVQPGPLDQVTEDDWDAVLRVNLKGTFFCTKYIVPQMAKRRYGKIVNIGSRASLGKLQRTVYSASKAGIIGLTRTWALELARHNINVNNVSPGPIATDMFVQSNPPGSPLTEKILRSVPLQRMGSPKDVANAVAFLASDEASFITGQTLFVCGGITIGNAHF